MTQPGKVDEANRLDKEVLAKARINPGVLCTTAKEINRTVKAMEWLDDYDVSVA